MTKEITRLLATAALLVLVPVLLVGGPPVQTTMSIAVSPTSISPGGTATVTATVTPNTGTINCGKGQIQHAIIPFPYTAAPVWYQLAHDLDVTSNKFSAVFDTNAISVVVGDKVKFRAGYSSVGSGCDFENQAIGQSPTTDLMIVPSGQQETPCPNDQVTGVYITIEGPDGNGMPAPGESGPWVFTVRLKACEDLDFVSAQGGANGWAPIKSYNQSAGTVEEMVKNKNTVYLWTIGAMSEYQEETLEVTVNGTIKNSRNECGKVKLLNGNWSALYSTDGGLTKTKSDYTTYTATIEVTCP